MSVTGHTVNGFGIARVGAGVTDLALGCRFYEHLGFVAGPPFDLGTALGAQSETPGSPLVTRSCAARASTSSWSSTAGPGHPGCHRPADPPPREPGPRVRLPLNRTGDLIHFGTHCDDFDAMLAVVRTAGGTVVERTRGQFPPPGLGMAWEGTPHGWVFVLDPNGVQIEIVGPRRAPTD